MIFYMFFPTKIPLVTQIHSLRINQIPVNNLSAGDHCSISLSQFNLVKKGSLLLTQFDTLCQNKQNRIIADITIYHPTPIKLGCVSAISVHSIIIETKLTGFLSKISPNQEIVELPKELLPKERARIIGVPTKEFIFDCELNSSFFRSLYGIYSREYRVHWKNCRH